VIDAELAKRVKCALRHYESPVVRNSKIIATGNTIYPQPKEFREMAIRMEIGEIHGGSNKNLIEGYAHDAYRSKRRTRFCGCDPTREALQQHVAEPTIELVVEPADNGRMRACVHQCALPNATGNFGFQIDEVHLMTIYIQLMPTTFRQTAREVALYPM
jgi:hypothetical protein